MELYDPIHGLITVSPLAKKIIDTEEFQRLRNIKQLGCCYYVFPGASHNRFEHSIGVYHLANKYIDILNKNEEFSEREIICITIAGLIHDIGHGPFSHLFDEITPERKNHEYRSGQLFTMMNQKYNLGFNDSEINFMIQVIYPKNIQDPKQYLYQIISNENGIDVDRFDYLSRDIKMIGLNYGIECDRIMNHSKIENNEIIYSDKVKINIEDYFNTRFIMYKEVYNHNTVRGIEQMIKQFLYLVNDLFSIYDTVNNDIWELFIQFNDNILDYPKIMGIQISNELEEVMENIKQRKIYKCIGEIISCDSSVNSELIFPKEDLYTESINKDIIIDNVKLSYYGKEPCKYYHEKNIHYQYKNIHVNKDEYITKIYYKNKDFEHIAREIYNSSVLLLENIRMD
tara:strand:+ start:415 stop:1611 length:1197 start_codon:yes stop_codon:yes gene_type:complete